MSPASLAEHSAALVALARRVHVLGSISWPQPVLERFVAEHRAGRTALPVAPSTKVKHGDVRRALDAFIQRVDADEPCGRYLINTARSYERAAAMLEAAGTPEFSRISAGLYPPPSELVVGLDITHVTLAERLLALTDELRASLGDESTWICLTAEGVKHALEERIATAFGPGAIQVVIDPDLASKAAASSDRVRLRAGTCFAHADIDQLAEHELMVHAATAKNGRAQPVLSALGLGAPRTTKIQEGLATFAELTTGVMDLSRLRRIGLRVLAVDRALQGADFVEVFRFFLDAGQTEAESAASAMRVFRGAPLTGGSAFTKDCVYLPGLVAVHTFMRSAIAEGRVELIGRLFSGRMTLGDLIDLEPAFDDGTIAPGQVLPPWAAEPRRVAASLSFSVVVNGLHIGRKTIDALSQD